MKARYRPATLALLLTLAPFGATTAQSDARMAPAGGGGVSRSADFTVAGRVALVAGGTIRGGEFTVATAIIRTGSLPEHVFANGFEE